MLPRIDEFEFARGRVLAGKYEVIERLGKGWEGEVYRLRELATGIERAAKFFDPACDWAPERDFDLCTRVDEFDFVLQLETGASPPRLRRIDVPKPPIEIV